MARHNDREGPHYGMFFMRNHLGANRPAGWPVKGGRGSWSEVSKYKGKAGRN